MWAKSGKYMTLLAHCWLCVLCCEPKMTHIFTTYIWLTCPKTDLNWSTSGTDTAEDDSLEILALALELHLGS